MRLSARDFGQTFSQTPIELPIRRDLRWDFDDVETNFVAENMLITSVWATFSVGAPATERFFVSALRPLIDRVADAKLRGDMDGMLMQEAMHAAAHAKFNRALAAKGLSIQRAEAYVDDLLTRTANASDPMEMVGMLAAGEHVMSTIAKIYLSDPSIGAAMSPSARQLLDYHMLEEVEHGSVGHDVFKYFHDDDYLQRARTGLKFLVLNLHCFMAAFLILATGRSHRITLRDWARFWEYGLIRPRLFRRILTGVAEYFMPFHNSPVDSRVLSSAQAHQARPATSSACGAATASGLAS